MVTTDLLHRRSHALSTAHIELLRLLAAVAVEDYLREIEATDAPADDRELAR